MAPLLEGKFGLVLGVANKRSIAWSISQALADDGATLAFTYQGERLEENVRELAGSVHSPLVLPCDVSKDEEVERLFESVDREFKGLDILVHCVAFAQRQDLEGEYLATSRDGFRIAHDVSAYSLVALARGIPGFTKMLEYVREKAPLRRNTDPAEVGDAALFLCSPMGRGITGEVLFVDCGYHILGM